MNAEHTAGPWRTWSVEMVTRNCATYPFTAIVAPDAKADRNRQRPDFPTIALIPHTLAGDLPAERAANARLIAEAPRLAAELARLLGCVICNYDPETVRAQGYADSAAEALRLAGVPLAVGREI